MKSMNWKNLNMLDVAFFAKFGLLFLSKSKLMIERNEGNKYMRLYRLTSIRFSSLKKVCLSRSSDERSSHDQLILFMK